MSDYGPAGYDWRITLVKAIVIGGTSAALIVVASLAAYLSSGDVPTRWLALVPAGQALLAAVLNWLKNRNA